MSELTAPIAGSRLTADEYLDDFKQRFWDTGAEGCWKLERSQHFVEPDNESWQAFHAGDWARALELMEQGRPALQEYQDRIARSGFQVRRVRVVEHPISPYLIWELNSLRIRQECGGAIRVVGPEAVEEFERDTDLPEIFVVGTAAAYQVLYGEDGGLRGAIRSLDAGVVRQWAELSRSLYDQGEPLDSFFRREVAGLRPPHAA